MERAGLHVSDVLLLFCMFALRKDERKLQYSRSNLLGFINTGYFTSDKYNEPDGIKNATHNTFSNFRKKLATGFFWKWLNTNRDLLYYNRPVQKCNLSDPRKALVYGRFLGIIFILSFCHREFFSFK
jgi:hypothetical protein